LVDPGQASPLRQSDVCACFVFFATTVATGNICFSLPFLFAFMRHWVCVALWVLSISQFRNAFGPTSFAVICAPRLEWSCSPKPGSKSVSDHICHLQSANRVEYMRAAHFCTTARIRGTTLLRPRLLQRIEPQRSHSQNLGAHTPLHRVAPFFYIDKYLSHAEVILKFVKHLQARAAFFLQARIGAHFSKVLIHFLL
jgi:hypothetical protein